MKIVVSVHVSLIIFILLIVSYSLSCNFNHCATCFQSYINITSRSTQNDLHKYQMFLKITHNKTINKEKWNLNIIISLSCWSVTLATGTENLVFVKTENTSGWPYRWVWFIVFTKSPYLLPYIWHRSIFFWLNTCCIMLNSLQENVS